MAGFQVTDHGDPRFRITVTVQWGFPGLTAPSADEMQTALTNTHATAFAEATKRLEAIGD